MDKCEGLSQKKIDHFSSMAQDWWRLDGPCAGLHSSTKVRIEFIIDGLLNNGQIFTREEAPFDNVTMLDVGCGGGILTEALARLGAKVTGVEPCEEVIGVAKTHLPAELYDKVDYTCDTIENLVRDKDYVGKFDAVIVSEVIEHVLDPASFLKLCMKMVKPKGSIFVTTINRTIVAWIGAILIAEYIICIVPRGTRQFRQLVKPQEIKRTLESESFKILDVRGTSYNIFSKTWSFSNMQSINYCVHAINIENY